MTRIVKLKFKPEKARTALYLDVNILEAIEALAVKNGVSTNKMSIALLEHALELEAEAEAKAKPKKKRTRK